MELFAITIVLLVSHAVAFTFGEIRATKARAEKQALKNSASTFIGTM
jgi:hypothetical protein